MRPQSREYQEAMHNSITIVCYLFLFLKALFTRPKCIPRTQAFFSVFSDRNDNLNKALSGSPQETMPSRGKKR